MALVACTECGAEISPRAVVCPRCGDVPLANLSRFLFKLFVAAIPLWFAISVIYAVYVVANEPK